MLPSISIESIGITPTLGCRKSTVLRSGKKRPILRATQITTGNRTRFGARTFRRSKHRSAAPTPSLPNSPRSPQRRIQLPPPPPSNDLLQPKSKSESSNVMATVHNVVPQFSLLPDPMQEYENNERVYKEQQKIKHASTVISKCYAIRGKHQLLLAITCWKKQTEYKRQHEMQCQQASILIQTNWKKSKQEKQIRKLNHANQILKRTLIKMIVTLKIMATRSKRKQVCVFVKQAVGPRFKTVIQTLRWHVIKCQRFVRSWLICSRARYKLLKLKFEQRVQQRCDEIRDEHQDRSQEYEDLKDRIVLERLRNVEEQWHDAHARVKSVMHQAQTAASRAKRRRLKFIKRQKQGAVEVKKVLQTIDKNSAPLSSKTKKNVRFDNSSNGTGNTNNKKSKENKKIANQANSKAGFLQICQSKNLKIIKQKEYNAKRITQKIVVDDEETDALSLQYMYLPKDVKSNLLRKVLRNRRKEWIQNQDEAKRQHANKVQTHRAINVADVQKMLKGSLHASELEKETIVRWKRKPLQLWTSIAPDLDWAIDIAITHCVWDC